MEFNKDILEMRLAEIRQMPPDQQAAAMEALSRDYPGLERQLRGDQAFSEEMAMAPSPQGGVAGPSSNPYAIYQASSPLEHAASGVGKFMGQRNRREAGEKLQQNSADRAAQVQGIMGSMLRSPDWEEKKRRGGSFGF